MSLQLRGLYPREEPGGLTFPPESGFTSGRFGRWSGAGVFSLVLPPAGGSVDFVSGPADSAGRIGAVTLAHGGVPAKVETGASYASGVDLMTDASGRAIAWSSGNKVAGRALEASGAAGEFRWISLG